MDYEHFIGELIDLSDTAKVWIKSPPRHDTGNMVRIGEAHKTPEFIDWRHRLASGLTQMVDRGYSLPGKIDIYHRYFQALHAGASVQDNDEKFIDDLRQTKIEIDYVIHQYRKHGEPPKYEDKSASADRAPPDKHTAGWLIDNVPAGWWWGIIVAFTMIGAGIFSAGMWVGGLFADDAATEEISAPVETGGSVDPDGKTD